MIERVAGANLLSKAQWLATACLAVCTGPLGGQILHPAAPLPSFEVATIKPSNGGDAIPSLTTPTESRTIDVTARNLIEQAYRIPWTPTLNERVIGGPDWIDSIRYDVDARIDPSFAAALQQMSFEERKDQTSLMMQSLLADRFQLKVHFESRELPIYALVVAKGGPKLAPAKQPPIAEGDQPTQSPSIPAKAEDVRQGIFVQYRGQAAEMTAKGVTLDGLARWLAGYSEIGGRALVNQTGLAGTYDFTLHWTRERLAAAGQGDSTASATSPEPEGPALFTGLQEQLGLRLLSTKGPVEVLVIDQIEKPSEN